MTYDLNVLAVVVAIASLASLNAWLVFVLASVAKSTAGERERLLRAVLAKHAPEFQKLEKVAAVERKLAARSDISFEEEYQRALDRQDGILRGTGVRPPVGMEGD